MAGPSRDGASEPGPLDDAQVAERWAELTAELGELEVPRDERSDRDPDLEADGDGATATHQPRPLGPRDYLEQEDPDGDRYVPPDPEPLQHSDPALTLGWVATVGSLLVGLVLFVVTSPGRWVTVGLGATLLCGVGLLLWRMPAHRDEDGDDGDGAVV
ncbi:hypothetical protein [Georgenia alba]|uniref:DUF3040 domain-containing protein n=1 Tax=Georgenia alba TaxID=2233858 RepID=A0ABW2QAD2_9MICO